MTKAEQAAYERGLEDAAKVAETCSLPIPIDTWRGSKKELTAAFALKLAEKIRALKSSSTVPVPPKPRARRGNPCGICENCQQGSDSRCSDWQDPE